MEKTRLSPLTLALIIIITTALIGLVGYGIYKYRVTVKENTKLREQFESQRNLEQEETAPVVEEQLSQEIVIATTSEVEVEEKPRAKEVIKEIVYINEPPPVQPAPVSVPTETTSAPIETTPTPVEIAEQIKVVNLSQTSFPDSYGGVYGSYRLAIEVSPKGGDILIPPTTSDSVGSRIIGFTYTISGDFKGVQNSEVDCGGLKANGYCKVKDGTTKILYAQVWAYPDEDSSGNYAVTFKKIRYYFNGVEKELNINSESEMLNLYY